MQQGEGLLCFICGKYFGAELLSHQSECQKLRDQTISKAQQYLQYFENKEFEQRIAENQLVGPSVEPPLDLSDIDLVGKYNDEAGECFSKALIPCVKCNRHFHFERLELHLRNCNGAGTHIKTDPSQLHKDNKKHKGEDALERKSPRKYRQVTCYLCGKNVALDTIDFHHCKCLEQRGVNYSKHPEHLNKLYEGPKPPSLHIPTRDDEDEFFEKYNQQALVIFYKSPVPCAICGRNFIQRSLEQHMKSCRPRSSPVIPPPEVDSHSGRRTAPTITTTRKEHKVVAAPEAGSLETEEAPKPVTKAASSLSLLKLKRKKRNQIQEEQHHTESNRNNHSTQHVQYNIPTSPQEKQHKRPNLKPTLSPSSKIPMLQYRNSVFHSYPKDRTRNEILIPKSHLAQVRTLENWDSNDNSTSAMEHQEVEHPPEINQEQLMEHPQEIDYSHDESGPAESQTDSTYCDEAPALLPPPAVLESPSLLEPLPAMQPPVMFEPNPSSPAETMDSMQLQETEKEDSDEEFIVNHVVHDNLQTSVESIEEHQESDNNMEDQEDSDEEAEKEKHIMDVDVTETLVRLPPEPIYVHEEGGTKLPRITHSPSKPTPRRFEVNHNINGIPSSSLGTESLKNFREKSPNPLTEHADRVLRKLEQERGGTPQSMVRFCTHCGLKFPGEGPAFRFCGSCGYARKWK